MKNLIVPKIESNVGRNHLPAAQARFANWATQFQYWLHLIHWVLPYDYNLTFQVCLLYHNFRPEKWLWVDMKRRFNYLHSRSSLGFQAMLIEEQLELPGPAYLLLHSTSSLHHPRVSISEIHYLPPWLEPHSQSLDLTSPGNLLLLTAVSKIPWRSEFSAPSAFVWTLRHVIIF